MANTEEAMAETKDARPAFNDDHETRPSEEEQPELAEEALPAFDKEKQSSAIVKGEEQKDEVGGSFGVKSVAIAEYVEALRGLRNMRESKEQAREDEEQDTSADEASKVAKEQLQELPACEPTFPASDELEGVHNRKGFNPLAPEALQTSEMPAQRRVLRRKSSQSSDVRRQRAKQVGPCPVLLVGSHFTKQSLLKPGRWVEVGRHPQAHIMLQNPAISKHHCKLQWRKGASSVELRALNGVTHVNDRRLNIGTASSLKHGDLLRIKGNRVCFRFLVDMNPCRPIHDQLPDIRTMSSFAAATKEAQHSSRTPEEDVSRKVRKMRALAAAVRQDAMQYEERLKDLQTQRSLRFQKLEEEMEKCSLFEKEEQRLEDMLSSSRDEWMERLQQQTISLEKFAAPLNEQTRETQLKRNQIEVLAKEEDRRLHPDRHVASLPEPSPVKMLTPEFTKRAAGKNLTAEAGNPASKEEAFPDAPARGLGLEEASEKSALLRPTVEVLQTAQTGADDDIDNLFGDFHSEDEVLEQGSKRQRVA